MTKREPNIPLLRKLVEWVEEQAQQPDDMREWRQWIWRGVMTDKILKMGGDPNVAIVHYDTPLEIVEEYFPYAALLYKQAVECGTAFCCAGRVASWADERYQFSSTVMIDGEPTHIATYAQRILGLNGDQAVRLWDSKNSAEDIRRLCEEFAGEPL